MSASKLIGLLLPLMLFGCRGTLYRLPAPGPAAEQRSVSLIPGAEERKVEEMYLEARARVLEINNLLATKRFDEAVVFLSLETQDWLKSMGGGAEVAEILASGKLRLRDGKVVEFDPVTTLVSEDVSKLSDTVDGVEEHETATRKEIFATLANGQLQRIVLIAEGGQWVLHRTRLPEPFDPPAK